MPPPAATLDVQQFQALAPLVRQWDAKLQLARQHKISNFARDAKTAMDYYAGPHNFLYSKVGARDAVGFTYNTAEDEPFRAPVFQMTFNKVAELVQLFGPVLYHRNPVRRVTPRKDWRPPDILLTGPPPVQPPAMPGQPGPDPASLSAYMAQLAQSQQSAFQAQQQAQQLQMDDALLQARASLLEQYLNYTPNELGLKEEMRLGVDEALIKGRGCLWTEVYVPGGTGQRMVGSFFDSVDNLLIDPDATRLDDAKWIARKVILPTWEVERLYGLPVGALKGKGVSESTEAKAYGTSEEGDHDRKTGKTADLMVIWKVWSKMGLGFRLKENVTATPLENAPFGGTTVTPSGGAIPQLTENFGDFVYMVISANVPFPLNCDPKLAEQVFGPPPRDLMGQSQMMQAAQQLAPSLQWPIPFHADDQWPVTVIDFHPLPGKPWPLAHIKPALGEQNFLDWAYSFLAGHVRNSCRDFVAIAKDAGEEIKETIASGRDLSVLELDVLNKNIGEVVQFLQHPELNPSLMPVIEAIERNFEKRTGLSEMMYGQTATQSRSAQDAASKQGAMQVRPDDMAERVEHAATWIARKEGIAARLVLKGQDVAPMLGPLAAQYWDRYVASGDLKTVAREFDFRIEASSAKKPNRDLQLANTQDGVQVILPLLNAHAQQTGDYGPLNAFIQDWAKARDFDAANYQLKPPPPPPAPPPGQQPQQQGPPPQGQQQQPQGRPQPAPRNGAPANGAGRH